MKTVSAIVSVLCIRCRKTMERVQYSADDWINIDYRCTICGSEVEVALRIFADKPVEKRQMERGCENEVPA